MKPSDNPEARHSKGRDRVRLTREEAIWLRDAVNEWSRDGRPTESAVSEWERWCADAALADAESAVQVHRDAVRRRKT